MKANASIHSLLIFSTVIFASVLMAASMLRPVEHVPLWATPLLLFPLVLLYFKNRFSFSFSQHAWKYLLGAGIFIRVMWAFVTPNIFTSDFSQYYFMAVDIYDGGPWLRADKQSGTGILVALFFWIFQSTSTKVALIPVVLCSILELWLIFRIALRFCDKQASSWILLILVLLPEHWGYTNVLASDVLFSSMLTASLYCFLQLKSGTRTIVATAVLLGLAQFIRPIAVLFFLAFLLLMFSTGQPWKEKFQRMSVFTITFLITLLPIIVFNYANFRSISLSSSQGMGKNMLIGTNFRTIGYYDYDQILTIDSVVKSTYGREPLSIAQRLKYENQVGKELAIERISSQPWRFMGLCFQKPIYLWGSPSGLDWSIAWVSPPVLKKAMLGLNALIHRYLVFLAALGLFLHRKKAIQVLPLLFLVVAGLLITASNLLLETQPRYFFPFLPILCIGASFLLSETRFGPFERD